MCGRYALTNTGDLVDRYAIKLEQQIRDNFNVAPTQDMPVVTAEGFEVMKWGLIPSWSKEFKASFTTFNARSETVDEKPMFRSAFKKHRCIVPATGYYEWLKTDANKIPYFIQREDRKFMSFAGIYEIWFDAENNPFKSYSIITTGSNEATGFIHDRMPVILDEAEEKYWLDANTPVAELEILLDPYEGEIVTHPVSNEVGLVKNNYAELLKPLNSQ